MSCNTVYSFADSHGRVGAKFSLFESIAILEIVPILRFDADFQIRGLEPSMKVMRTDGAGVAQW